MTMATKNDIFGRYLGEYLKASKARKGEILDSVCDVTGLHRKSVSRRFRVLQMHSATSQNGRGRPVCYGHAVTVVLKELWEMSGEACGELLHPSLSEYVRALRRDHLWKQGEETTQTLLRMSEATLKRRIGGFVRTRNNHKGISGTKPSLLKELIPISDGHWRDKPPGYGQTDTVAHCGTALVGDFIWSVNYTDMATDWGVRRAQWNKGREATRASLHAIKDHLPFPLLGLRPDTGGEFINWHLKGWCDAQRPRIEMERSRSYHKNDNAYVEQKNGHVIRRWIGYVRLDRRELLPVLNDLYETLDLFLNHFTNTRRCVEKERIGSKCRKRFDKAKTPYERALAHGD